MNRPAKQHNIAPARFDWSQTLSKAAGLFACSIGLLVMVAWYCHWPSIIQIFPQLPPMKFNTALGLVLCGAALSLLSTRGERCAWWMGGLAALMGMATILEYVTGRNLRIDQLFVTSYVDVASSFPGRMSPLAAGCFVLLGVALVLAAGTPVPSRTPVTISGLLACIVAVVGLMACFGYATGIETATGWGAFTRMGLHTATAFSFLGLGLLVRMAQVALRLKFSFNRWLPAAAAATLMIMIALVSLISFSDVREAFFWQRHSYEVISNAERFRGDFLQAQRRRGSYALVHEPETLVLFQQQLTQLNPQLDEIKRLTTDNVDQQNRVRVLARDLEEVEAYSRRLAEAREKSGLPAVQAMEATGACYVLVNRMLADLQTFCEAEKALLETRTESSRTDVSEAEQLLVGSSLIATVLLIAAQVVIGRQMTLRRRTETTLHEAVTLQNAILNAANYAIYSTDVNGVVTSLNATAEKWLGYASAEIVGQCTPEKWHEPAEMAAWARKLSQELGQPVKPGFDIYATTSSLGNKEEKEWTFIRKDGSRFPVWLSISPLTDEGETVTGYLGIVSDLSKRKESEEALHISEARFFASFEYATIGMALVSLDGRWMNVNRILCELVGYSPEELKAMTFQDITHPDDLDLDLDHVRELIAGKRISFKMEKRYLHKDGRVIWALLGVALVHDKDRKPLYFVSQIEDVTGYKEAMARQEDLTKKAQAAEQAKSEFLAIMSHEIRTPMNGVIGMTSILADTELSSMQRDCVETIRSSGESLLAVINDILDFSKIESGRMQIETQPFNLHRCIEGALDLFATEIRLKNLEAAYLLSPGVPANLLGDEMRLRQILVNLVGNAIKFTSEGEIVINVDCKSRDEQGLQLVFSIRDTGIGISPQGIAKLFQAFQQVDTSTTRKYGGTGLGLVISQRLAEFMGGTMWVESTPGVGSTFFFSALMQEAPGSTAPEQVRKKVEVDSLSALIVDDNATNRHILETQLRMWKIAPTAVASGREALDLLRKRTFDVALLDFQMPEMNGVVLAREIRRLGPMPMLLLSSSGETITGPDAAFFEVQLPKPIKHSQLFDAMQRIAGHASPQEGREPASRFDGKMAARHPLRILVAEDNPVNQKVGLTMLSRLGYRADLVANGREAVEAARTRSYNLILMDIQMPEMDGPKAARLIRQISLFKTPFIIALTAEALEGDREKFLALGFDDYLSKPLQIVALQEAMKLAAGHDGQARVR